MKKEVCKRGIYGIAYGGVVTIIALTVLMILDINPPIFTIWLYSCMGFLLGVYFGIASFIFEIEAWSPLKKTVIHYITSVIVYFIIAFSVGWVPLTFISIIISMSMFTFIYYLFWLGYRLYFKRVEASMNEYLIKSDK